MVTSAGQMAEQAAADTPRLTPQEAAALAGDPEVQLVDVRELAELERSGRIKGAVHVPRGLLEFKADPASPTHEPALAGGRRLVLFCAAGARAALAAQTLRAMGIARVEHVAGGGFEAMRAAGAPLA